MKILIACEESQAVCIEMRKRGHLAFSCDILPCLGGYPEWHIQGDVLEFLGKNKYNDFKGWDMMIGFPDCTFLSTVANKFYANKWNVQYSIFGYLDTRHRKRDAAVIFFMKLVDALIPKIAIENPVGTMSSRYRKPDQIIQPYHFGDSFQKRTCLWLKGLSKLQHTNIVDRGNMTEHKNGRIMPTWYHINYNNRKSRKQSRSVTFPGIAKAMAEQWTEDLNQTFIK